jgi:hypothetical protein
LFHLYRGSGLLEENRVPEAKEELERALLHKPRDSEGQGLLGVVYFRLGLYPRAITIYLEIVREWPAAVTPKLNLALCYLKTGQPDPARDLLEDVIRRVPDHPRAWGYLGLAFERLGRLGDAETAFERAGQPRLAARMRKLREPSEPPSEPSGSRDAMRLAARDASLELESGSRTPFSRDEARSDGGSGERWFPFELGREPVPLRKHSHPPRPPSLSPAAIAAPERDPGDIPPLSIRSSEFDLLGSLPMTSSGIAGMHRVELPTVPAERTSEGLVLLRAEAGFGVRRERIRALSQDAGLIDPVALRRRVRHRETEEPFAGPSGGFTRLSGQGFVVLDPPRDRELLVIELGQELFYVRETRLVAFHGNVQYENGRLPVGDAAPLAIVQLKGRGALVVEASRRLTALGVAADRIVTVRAATVLGWSGRLVGRSPASDQGSLWVSGAVAFSGEGTVFVDDP